VHVGNVRELCKNGRTNRDAVWDEDSGGLKGPNIRWGPNGPKEKGTFKGESVPFGTIVMVGVL